MPLMVSWEVLLGFHASGNHYCAADGVINVMNMCSAIIVYKVMK